MTGRLVSRAAGLNRRLSPFLLTVPVLIFTGAWYVEPYAFGCSVLVLAPLQLVGSLVGLALLALGHEPGPRMRSLAISLALAVSAVGAFLVLRSINWA